jgi:hypothetical protein
VQVVLRLPPPLLSADGVLSSRFPANRRSLDGSPTSLHVTRPPNSFLLYRRAKLGQLRERQVQLPLAEASVAIGAMWRAETEAVRQAYAAQATDLRQLHRERHPGWKYSTGHRRRSAPTNLAASSAASVRWSGEHHDGLSSPDDLRGSDGRQLDSDAGDAMGTPASTPATRRTTAPAALRTAATTADKPEAVVVEPDRDDAYNHVDMFLGPGVTSWPDGGEHSDASAPTDQAGDAYSDATGRPLVFSPPVDHSSAPGPPAQVSGLGTQRLALAPSYARPVGQEQRVRGGVLPVVARIRPPHLPPNPPTRPSRSRRRAPGPPGS